MTAPAGSEDAGLVLSARMLEAARAEDRERIAVGIEEYAAPAKTAMDVGMNAGLSLAATVARIARTPPPAGSAQGSQEASNGPVGDGDAGDGRGHGRDDESGRGADS